MTGKGSWKDMGQLKRAQRREPRMIRCLETCDLQGKMKQIGTVYSKRDLERT